MLRDRHKDLELSPSIETETWVMTTKRELQLDLHLHHSRLDSQSTRHKSRIEVVINFETGVQLRN